LQKGKQVAQILVRCVSYYVRRAWFVCMSVFPTGNCIKGEG